MLDAKTWQIITEVYTQYGPNLTVSTVELPSLGFDLWQGRPYETCVFAETGDSNVIARYHTKEEAIVGHAEWVEHYNNS